METSLWALNHRQLGLIPASAASHLFRVMRGPLPRQSAAPNWVWTDPLTGACTNASDPASYNCAFGGGDGCVRCFDGALCPGGSRLWPRVGYWAASDSVSSVAPCPPPDPLIKCQGWNVSAGLVQCGGAAARALVVLLQRLCGEVLPLRRRIALHPAQLSLVLGDRYRGALGLLCGVVASATVVSVFGCDSRVG